MCLPGWRSSPVEPSGGSAGTPPASDAGSGRRDDPGAEIHPPGAVVHDGTNRNRRSGDPMDFSLAYSDVSHYRAEIRDISETSEEALQGAPGAGPRTPRRSRPQRS